MWQDDPGTGLPLPGTRWVFNWKYPTDSAFVPAIWPNGPNYELRAVKGTYTAAGSGYPPRRHISNAGSKPDDVDNSNVGFCLDIENAYTGDGGVPQVYTCTGSSNQRLLGSPDNGDLTCWDATGLAFKKDDLSWTFWAPTTSGFKDGVSLRFAHSRKCLNIPGGCIPSWQGPTCEEIQLQQFACGAPDANPNEAFYFFYPNCKLDGDVSASDIGCCSYQRPDGTHCGTDPGSWSTKPDGQFCSSNIQCQHYNCFSGACGGVIQ